MTERRHTEERRSNPVGRRKIDRAETFAERTIWNPQFLVGLLVVLLLITLLVQLLGSRAENNRDRAGRERAQQQITQLQRIAATNSETLTRLKDCTEPTGTCNKRNQEATTQAIQGLVRTSVAAGMCSAIVHTEVDYNECIKNQLGAQIGD